MYIYIYIREHILAYTVHWAKGTAQGMVIAVFGAAAAFGTSSLFVCSFLTGIVLMLATPVSTSAQTSVAVALADLMAARVLPLPLFERSKGERSKGSSSNVNAPDLLPILCGKEESGPQHSVCRLPAAGRLSAPRGETLPLSPPQPMEHFIASARVRAGKKGAAPPSAPSRSTLSLDGKPLPPSHVGLLPRPRR